MNEQSESSGPPTIKQNEASAEKNVEEEEKAEKNASAEQTTLEQFDDFKEEEHSEQLKTQNDFRECQENSKEDGDIKRQEDPPEKEENVGLSKEQEQEIVEDVHKLTQKEKEQQNDSSEEKQIKIQKQEERLQQAIITADSSLPDESKEVKVQTIKEESLDKVEAASEKNKIQNKEDAGQMSSCQNKLEQQIKISSQGQSPNKNPQPQQVPSVFKSSLIIKEAESERVGSIFEQFIAYYYSFQKTMASYKIIINNVCLQLQNRREYKKNLQDLLVTYFQDYSKIHKEFQEKAFKISKEQTPSSANKLVNIKEEMRHCFVELHYLRKNIGAEAQKLDNYINNYIIKSIKQIFGRYREELIAEQRRQFDEKDDFYRQEKMLGKVINTLSKMCKKGREGEKYKSDIFVQLINFVNGQKKFKQKLINLGKSTILLRKGFIQAEKKLFFELQRVMNQFKNQQKTVYIAAKIFDFLEDYTKYIEEKVKFECLCTITDVDYIRGVLQLNTKKNRVQFSDKHFEQFLEMPFFAKAVGDSRDLLKGAATKNFLLAKKGCVLVHTISDNLVEFDRELSECKQILAIKSVNAKIFGEGAIEFSWESGLIFKQTNTMKMQFKDDDCAQELIGFLNEMQSIKSDIDSK